MNIIHIPTNQEYRIYIKNEILYVNVPSRKEYVIYIKPEQ
jgi:hypothetical protein